MRNVLMTGATGQIGSVVLSRLGEIATSKDLVYFLEHNRGIDTSTLEGDYATQRIKDIRVNREYDVALHFAANIHTKYCDKLEHQGEFIRDNVILTERVCNQSKRVIMISTDNVFNGMDGQDYKENDKIDPCNFYGVTKAEAEKIVLDHGGAVIRIQTMTGVDHNLIIDRVLEGIDGKDYWPFWADQYVRPTFFEDFLSVVKKVYDSEAKGVYHVSCGGQALSRAEIAQRVLDVFKAEGIEMKRTTLEYGVCDNPKFPRRLVLDTVKTKQDLGINFTHVDEAIKQHVLRLRKN